MGIFLTPSNTGNKYVAMLRAIGLCWLAASVSSTTHYIIKKNALDLWFMEMARQHLAKLKQPVGFFKDLSPQS